MQSLQLMTNNNCRLRKWGKKIVAWEWQHDKLWKIRFGHEKVLLFTSPFCSYIPLLYYVLPRGRMLPSRCIVLKNFTIPLIKEVWYNCNGHHSAYLFIIARSSHSHKEQKQPQRTLLWYCCSVTMIEFL